MTDEADDRTNLTMNAALDGELDAMGMIDFERSLTNDPRSASRHEQLVALRSALRDHATEFRAPDALRQRIAAMAEKQDGVAPPATVAWRHPRAAIAAALALAFVSGGIGFGLIERVASRQPYRVAMLLVDDHRRASLAREPVDVASSDRHTVKPWFDARLAVSPPVIDLTGCGFTLVGGRADVVDGAAVPTVVYRMREHLVSLTALPTRATRDTAATTSVNGYEAMSWLDGGFQYWAVSDLPRADLDAFVAAFKAGVVANVENH
jgi:anti-sigma factor RsiW